MRTRFLPILASCILATSISSRAEAEPAPPADGAASADVPARADGRAHSVCGTEPLDELARRASASVVEAEGSGAWSLGFVFGERDLVVVPLAVAEAGRGILVHQRGRTLRATVAAIDDASELALLRAPGLEGASPLAPSPFDPSVGAAALVPARPIGEDGAADQVSTGTITQRQGARFRTSARVSFGFDAGAPVLDCRGRVLGATTWFADEAVTTDRAAALLARVRGGEAPYEGRWSIAHPSFHALLELDGERAWGGADLGLALVGHDRWELGLSGRFLGTGGAPEEGADGFVTRPWGFRGGADLRAGAKLMVTEGAMPLYAVPHVGFGFDVTALGAERSRGAVTDEGCSEADPCPVRGEASPVPTEVEARLFPQVGLGVRLGFVELGYTFRLDVEEPAGSSHTIGLGVQL